jgi:dTDP-4-amino-4,6-dideoxygalactose transaminase
MSVPFLDLAAVHRPLHGDLTRALHEVIDSSAFIGGPHVERFEHAWAQRCGRRHGVGVANGTDAIALALRALGIGPGDEVVVPANTFVATAEAVLHVGARPRFVDVDARTLLMTPSHLAAAITPATAAVVVVHLFGQVAEMDGVLDVARRAGLAVIEDAAQAHDATRDGRPAGSFGDAAAFSFYPGKNLGALGDAGMVVTDDASVAEQIRSLGNHGRAAGAHHLHTDLGLNSRLDGMQAAALNVKLGHLAEWTEGRRLAADAYAAAWAEAPELPVEPVRVDPRGESAHHLYVVRVPHRQRVIEGLRWQGTG